MTDTAQQLQAVLQAAVDAVFCHRRGYTSAADFDANEQLLYLDRLGDALDEFFNAKITPLNLAKSDEQSA